MPVTGDKHDEGRRQDQRQPVGDGHGHEVGDGGIGHRQRKHSKKDLLDKASRPLPPPVRLSPGNLEADD